MYALPVNQLSAKSKHWREASTLLVDYSYNHVDPTQTNNFQIYNYKLYVWYLSYIIIGYAEWLFLYKK